MKKKFLLFDFDGTIADTLPAIIEILQEVGKEFGYDLSKEDVIKLRQMSPLEIITQFKFPPWRIPSLITKIRNKLADRVGEIKIIPGMEKALLELKFKGYRMGILTSNLKETVDKFLVKNKLLIFDQILSEPAIFNKSKAFRNFLKENNLGKSDVIYIGDEVRDIDFTRESGVKIISVTWGFNERDILVRNKPAFIADKPEDILKILKKTRLTV